MKEELIARETHINSEIECLDPDITNITKNLNAVKREKMILN